MVKHFTVGVAGHVDHGKTSLVQALSGIDTDRMPEEKRRGMSIESGVAPMVGQPGINLALVDVPGHKDYLKNTVRGLSCVDMAILVVAADDGVMPQTRDHLEILEFFKARSGLVVLTKSDMVDDETLELAELEVRELIQGHFLEGKKIIPFSSKRPEGADIIRRVLFNETEQLENTSRDLPFRLWIDQVRQLKGFGTIVSGTVLSGSIQKAEPLQLMPACLMTRARFLESHGQRIDTAHAGQRIGINLHKVPFHDVQRGMLVTASGQSQNTYLLNADLQLLAHTAGSLKTRVRVKLYIGTLVVGALMVIMDKDMIRPGESGLVQFRLSRALPVSPKDRFVVTLLNENRIMGGGKVLEITAEKFTRSRAERILPGLLALREGDVSRYVDSILNVTFGQMIFPDKIHRRSGLPLAQLERVFVEKHRAGHLMTDGNKGFILKKHGQNMKDKLMDAAHRAMGNGPLKNYITVSEFVGYLRIPVSEDLVQVLVGELLSEKKLYKDQRGFSIPDHKHSLSRDDENLARHILEFAEQSGFVPFSASRFCIEQDLYKNRDKAKKMLHFLHNQNQLVKLTNKRFIGFNAMEKIKARIEGHIRDHGAIVLADSQSIMGYGRTMAVPVFEYLDSVGFTKRHGDERKLC
ncbi:MAG: selenocysteine-specific translation elongation factor [Proteobacteria bacterium]|nr:selenocysteine-specific translation elongation factor [Pseudomonadota bacterium]